MKALLSIGMPVLLFVSIAYGFGGPKKKEAVKMTILGGLAVVIPDAQGKDQLVKVPGILVTMRNDGLLGWTLTPELKKSFEDKAEKGIILPSPAKKYESGK